MVVVAGSCSFFLMVLRFEHEYCRATAIEICMFAAWWPVTSQCSFSGVPRCFTSQLLDPVPWTLLENLCKNHPLEHCINLHGRLKNDRWLTRRMGRVVRTSQIYKRKGPQPPQPLPKFGKVAPSNFSRKTWCKGGGLKSTSLKIWNSAKTDKDLTIRWYKEDSRAKTKTFRKDIFRPCLMFIWLLVNLDNHVK